MSFNANGFYGEGQKIAQIEDTVSGVFDNHEAFQFAAPDTSRLLGDPPLGWKVTYQEEPKTCTTAADCVAAYGGTEPCLDLGHGLGKQCVVEHASQALSVAAGANDGQPHGAAKARFYYPNRFDFEDPDAALTNVCYPKQALKSYEWLAGEGVDNVTESWGCFSPSDSTGGLLEGFTQDWFARYFDMFISKAAGNQGQGRDPDEPACPYSLNSMCVGGTYDNANLGMWCHSSYTNYLAPGEEQTDREEPDVAAFAGAYGCSTASADVDVMDVAAGASGSTTGWTTEAGTSFAAPAVTALAALCREVAPGGGHLSETVLRVILRLAPFWQSNPDALPYSMGTTANDWKDGAGKPLGTFLYAICTGETRDEDGGQIFVGSSDGDFDGSPWGSESECIECGNDPPLGPLSVPASVVPRSTVAPGAGDGRLTNLLWSGHVGGRIRAVMSWDSCPSSPDNAGFTGPGAPVPISTDYDLFLINRSRTPNGEIVYSSQSVLDVNEGFDVEVPEGDYEVVVGYDAASVGCDSANGEPYAFGIWAY